MSTSNPITNTTTTANTNTNTNTNTTTSNPTLSESNLTNLRNYLAEFIDNNTNVKTKIFNIRRDSYRNILNNCFVNLRITNEDLNECVEFQNGKVIDVTNTMLKVYKESNQELAKCMINKNKEDFCVENFKYDYSIKIRDRIERL